MKIESIVRSVMIVIGIAIVALIINNLGTTYLKNQAVDGCLTNSTAKWESESNSGYNFSSEWFTTCLKEKGLK